jgi:hypothetical protein
MRLRPSPWRAALLFFVLLMAMALAGGPALTAPQTGGATATPPKQSRATVTLITGDRVTVVPSPSGDPNVIFDPVPGSESTGFDVLRDGTHLHVVPDDVASLVPEVLDPALFDVTSLVEMGYDDRPPTSYP